ncbi:glycerol-3-phosphate dehydrogenase (NAD(P)+) [Thermostichus sp. MS-CIW-21]|jgi:glycerol-3-phosphate dehydrogenase (NAD(P)+)|uniref:Glycerol-3-phosphate dehydrogenase [NAD(P)+] n=1 Tax=Synechococcus sp. (strain JA-3-3Ab) TaxID=321327 RepID=GPDA_SYNJA|nr:MULTISPECIES: NAD(P)H-dependent glycerol-3-phosphate dehydrogenase [unclassified Synechococcus]Q2JX02.1 RecName: Full=Glycerol-3-phosphate dehydrogenase [NAD(P)+]; AltName: Full=NAD(P)H-dependent glycerol-3-phosphate dehydrogenase [Synechococcus sp. JA-3-3Ab]ABC98698.1 NAD-dependent glycerol-3-phosphate dehydrogenase family protein [Synechococcus sp. JA-3-3Ab]PIK85839.1 glycerol-3-phosphate dehydrogenase [Synechococcus sp. 63AY4M2]PIK89100.1 glycerol-3-phosphate dehydrogenase [Synechococcus 
MKTNTTSPQKIAILGAGAWGSTLALLAQAQGHRVQVWDRRKDLDLKEVLQGSQILISAVSMAGVRPVAEVVRQVGIPPQVILVSATKGLDPLQLLTPAQIWGAAFPNQPLVVLSGPNLSAEIRQGLPAAAVVASRDLWAAVQVQHALASERFRLYTSSDPLGVELGGILKNVIAIAVGVCDALHLGTNARAALVTRGLAEMIRVGSRLGARPETFNGLSGLGDLLATCHSPLSRNYQVGYGLGQGRPLSQVLAEIEGTAEGVYTAPVVVKIAAQHNIRVPITQEVHRLLQGQTTPTAALARLMERQLTSE